MGSPDLDGQTVVGLLKGSTLLAQTPVVAAVTAWPEDYAAEMAKAYGCDGHLSKPISAHLFAEQVSSYLRPVQGEPEPVPTRALCRAHWPPCELVPASAYTVEVLIEAYNQTGVDYIAPMPMNSSLGPGAYR